MYAFPLRAAAVALAAAAGLSACTTPYGYGGVSMGVGNGYYDSSYGGYGYGYPGYGYGYPASYGYSPYGWYDDYYYPGTGYYVYDSYRRPHRWTDAQRRYWTVRRQQAVSSTSTTRPIIRENWDGFRRERAVRSNRTEQSVSRSSPVRIERSSHPARTERSVDRSERILTAREDRRSEARSSDKAEKEHPGRGRGNRDD